MSLACVNNNSTLNKIGFKYIWFFFFFFRHRCRSARQYRSNDASLLTQYILFERYTYDDTNDCYHSVTITLRRVKSYNGLLRCNRTASAVRNEENFSDDGINNEPIINTASLPVIRFGISKYLYNIAVYQFNNLGLSCELLTLVSNIKTQFGLKDDN